jgi:hypothetical protein
MGDLLVVSRYDNVGSCSQAPSDDETALYEIIASKQRGTDLVAARGRIKLHTMLFPRSLLRADPISSVAAKPSKEDRRDGRNCKAAGRTESASAPSILVLPPVRRRAGDPSR